MLTLVFIEKFILTTYFSEYFYKNSRVLSFIQTIFQKQNTIYYHPLNTIRLILHPQRKPLYPLNGDLNLEEWCTFLWRVMGEIINLGRITYSGVIVRVHYEYCRSGMCSGRSYTVKPSFYIIIGWNLSFRDIFTLASRETILVHCTAISE